MTIRVGNTVISGNWESIPEMDGNSGKFMSNDGVNLEWKDCSSYKPPILSFQWSDHIINDIQWLRSDTFSWQSGGVYQTAYQHLVDDYESVTESVVTTTYYAWGEVAATYWTLSEDPQVGDVCYDSNGNATATTVKINYGDDIKVSNNIAFLSRYPNSDYTITGEPVKQSETETIGDTTITFYRATDGHKIVLTDQEANVEAIFSATGCSDYFILDTANTRFKLRREKHRYIVDQKIDGANWYKLYSDGWLEQGGMLPLYISNSTENLSFFKNFKDTNYSIFGYGNYSGNDNVYYSCHVFSNFGTNGCTVYFADKHGTLPRNFYWQACGYASVPSISTTINKYLYFYVGEYAQTAIEQTAGLNSELFNGKVDLDGSNATFAHIIETYKNGTSWYRVWSDGWIEQGGRASVSNDGTTTVTLLKPFSDSNYYVNWISCNGVSTAGAGTRGADTLTTTSFRLYNGQDVTMLANWYACGY